MYWSLGGLLWNLFKDRIKNVHCCYTRYCYSILQDNHVTPKHEIYTKKNKQKNKKTNSYSNLLVWNFNMKYANLLAHMSNIEPSRSSCFIVPLRSQPLWELWEIPDIYIYIYIYITLKCDICFSRIYWNGWNWRYIDKTRVAGKRFRNIYICIYYIYFYLQETKITDIFLFTKIFIVSSKNIFWVKLALWDMM